MLTRLSDFLLRHEPITRLLSRIVLLLILACVALDFHYLSLDVSDIADSLSQLQQDISGAINGNNGDDDAAAPTRM